eukprot:CAMPEP_0171066312 /NCGR_PEP_ID=MMETSP0766_2-20121228/7348_1 /TAXON_ID=439317 /ORGANISM="Gambierdiscus australes, Strain CAWD 149" /LENGTH=186 /DNA_ID=CAMNT_0011522473 /DNA_START=258 /DNA_END=814 /DNA_ORIENTATION=+
MALSLDWLAHLSQTSFMSCPSTPVHSSGQCSSSSGQWAVLPWLQYTRILRERHASLRLERGHMDTDTPTLFGLGRAGLGLLYSASCFQRTTEDGVLAVNGPAVEKDEPVVRHARLDRTGHECMLQFARHFHTVAQASIGSKQGHAFLFAVPRVLLKVGVWDENGAGVLRAHLVEREDALDAVHKDI